MMSTATARPNMLFRLVQLVERASAQVQGKGYGAGTIEREVRLALQALGRTPALAVDIGGNIGNYSAELRRRCPELDIHVFEPSSTNIAKLHKRFDADTRVHIVPSAVAETTGSATLFANAPGSGLGSLTKRKLDHFGIEMSHEQAIDTLRFEDYWIGHLQRRRIDLVKIDIEGHELSALKGFGNALDATSVVQFEFGGCNIDTRTYFQDFWYFFQERGFDLFRIAPLGLEPIPRYRESDEFFSTTNYVARNRRQRH